MLKPSFRRNISDKTNFFLARKDCFNIYIKFCIPLYFLKFTNHYSHVLANENTFLQSVIMIYLKYERLNAYQNLPFVDKISFPVKETFLSVFS